MPHNRTRVWAGLAIVAVTIPAVGTFYYGSNGRALQGAPIAVAGRTGIAALANMPGGQPGIAQNARRDYMAEVRAAAGTDESEPLDDAAELAAFEDEIFDLSPIGETPRIAYDPENEAPEPPPDVEPASPDETPQVAYSTDAPLADGLANADEPIAPTLSDANVYRLVVNNLPENDREEFVRTYASMTNAQRVELLDGFRAQLEDDAPQL